MKLSVFGLICIGILCTLSPASAESEYEPALEIGALSIPSTPAFEILGVSPSSVARPGSAKELVVSLFSAARDGDSAFPRNLSVEFSPFWWTYHPDLTWNEYVKEDDLTANILRTFSFSLATSETKRKIEGAEVEGTGFGFGFRTSLLKGSPSSEAKKNKNKLVNFFQDHVDAIIPDDPSGLPRSKEGVGMVAFDGISDPKLSREVQSLQEAFRNSNLYNIGSRIEFGGAISYNFPDDKWKEGEFNSAGAWLTCAYRTKEDSPLHSFDFLGVFRYLWNEVNDENLSTYDLGGRIIWMSPRDNLPLSASVEYVYRFASENEKEDSDKLSFIAEYRASKTWSLFASLGKTFDQDFEGDEDFVAIFGINLGYGKGPVVTP